jgi:DNA-directed RNA polymerase subunit F
MSAVVSQGKPRRMARRRARGVRIVKIAPLTPDEIIRLVEKARAETDPEKVRRIKDRIVNGFYGQKVVSV